MAFPLMLGALLFAASLTPSLIPRGWLVQGVLGGLVAALGYLIGRIAVVIRHALHIPAAPNRVVRIVRIAAALPVVIVLGLSLAQAPDWQNGIRMRMEMPLLDTSNTLRMTLTAVAVFAGLVCLGYALQWVFDRLRYRLDIFLPARTANVAGLVLTVLLVVVVTRDGLLDRVVRGLDQSYTAGQALFDTAPPPPEDPRLAGGPGSLIDWGAMGQPGRDYVTSGPDAAEIAAFTGRPALDPIRVYAGLAQAETPEARATVALAELERLGGFERAILVVAMPTGTGWLDPGSVDVLEHMHGGDVATIAVQYSYLQSPLALILETRSGLDQARALISAVHDRWRAMPPDARPRLYMHGLSLGAWASMHGTDLFALLDDPIDGALWVGPPFPSALWQDIVAERNPRSAYVAPVVGDGRLVRFASHTRGAGGPGGWGAMRLAFLQYSSDPIVFYEPASFFRAPAWMRELPAADVSPDLRFMPIVTQFQLAVDMALANSAPPGHGHSYYGPDYVGPWAAVTAPEGWTAEDAARLAAHCGTGVKAGCGEPVE